VMIIPDSMPGCESKDYSLGCRILQFMLALVVGAKTMVEVAKVGRDPLVKKFLGNSVGEAQLAASKASSKIGYEKSQEGPNCQKFLHLGE